MISIFFGAEDEILTKYYFGVDSFVEAISGLGMLQIDLQMRNSNITNFAFQNGKQVIEKA